MQVDGPLRLLQVRQIEHHAVEGCDAGLRIFESLHDLLGMSDFFRRGLEPFVNDGNLRRVNGEFAVPSLPPDILASRQ